MIEVAALGELLIDFAEKSTDADGYPTMAAHAGGAPANFLAALNHFGHKGALLGKVGDDAFGKMLLKTLEDAGVKPIEAEGCEFNPDFHNAVMHVEDDTVGENIVVQEFQKGYMYKDSVVRYSMVKVAN